MINNTSGALTAIAAQFAGVHRQHLAATASLGAYEARLRSIRTLGLAGGAMAGAGIFGLDMLKKPLEEASKFQTEVARFSALGLGDKATTDAVRFAKGMDIMGQSARDNMVLIRDATTMMGSLEHATAIAPMLARMRFGIEGVMGEGKGLGFEHALQASLKVGELRGALVNKSTGEIDPAKFGNTLNLMTQAYVASGGRVKPQDYLAALKTGGVSTKLMNDEMFFYGLGHFMQESGGSRTGTSSMSLFQNWQMGRMPQGVAERMAALGLLNKDSIHYGKTGHITKVDPMGIVAPGDFASNPFKWVLEQAVPRLQSKGFSGDALNMQLSSLTGQRTAGNLVDQYVRESKVAQAYVERARQASSVDSLYKLAGGTMHGKEVDLTAKWSSLLQELGDVTLPVAIKGTEWLIRTIQTMTAFSRENPGLTKFVVLTSAATAALTTLGGVMLITRASFSALGLAMALPAAGGAAGLARTAASLGMIGTAIRGMGLVGLAGGAGYAAGSAVYNATAGTRYGDAVGSQIAKVLAFFGNEEAQQSVAAMNRYDSRYTRGGAAPSPTPIFRVHLKGREIFTAVDQEVGRSMNGASRGTTQFDVNMAMPPISLPSGAK